jgi:hypothetical protein
MSNPFDYVTSITYNKNDMMKDTENDQLAESGYNPYLTNKSLSYFPDTLLYANEMNMLNHVDSKLQYSYLLNSIRPKKRFSKWVKKQEDIDIEAIKEYYKYSTAKAEAALSLLSPQQINEIKKRLNKGG